MQILITAPSLDENENVSGISTLVREIISNSRNEFLHFRAGRRDGERGGLGWILKQILLPMRFGQTIRRDKPEVVHINTAFVPLSILRDAALVSTAKKENVPTILHLHGGRFLIEEFSNKKLEFIASKMLKKADIVLVLSQVEKENLMRRWDNLNIEILPNAVSTEQIAPSEKKNSEKTIIFVGRIHESKGLHEIIEACKILKKAGLNFNFRCFGIGPQKDFFTGEMSAILGEKFYFGGIISGKAKWRELSEADIFLLPSRYGEGLPIAMLEAMAAGCVPVAADVASVRTVVKTGENGFLVEPYNVKQTAEILETLLSGKIDLKKLNENARRTIEENFSMSEYIEKLEKIYREIGENEI